MSHRLIINSIESFQKDRQENFQQNEKDIHTILNNRLIDIQHRKYSVQPKYRG